MSESHDFFVRSGHCQRKASHVKKLFRVAVEVKQLVGFGTVSQPTHDSNEVMKILSIFPTEQSGLWRQGGFLHDPKTSD